MQSFRSFIPFWSRKLRLEFLTWEVTHAPHSCSASQGVWFLLSSHLLSNENIRATDHLTSLTQKLIPSCPEVKVGESHLLGTLCIPNAFTWTHGWMLALRLTQSAILDGLGQNPRSHLVHFSPSLCSLKSTPSSTFYCHKLYLFISIDCWHLPRSF